MLDMSWGEIMVIGAVALIVIGPKDLPKALRTVGQMTGKLRRMAAEFQGQFNEAMREAELDEVRRQIQGVNDSVSAVGNQSFNPIQTIRDELQGAIEKPAEKHAGDVPPVEGAPAEKPAEVIPPAPPIAHSVPPVADPAEAYATARSAELAAAPHPADELTPADPVGKKA